MANPWLDDHFTEGSDTALTSHTPDVGGAWSGVTGYGTNGTVEGGSGYLIHNSGTEDCFKNAATPNYADYTVTVYFRKQFSFTANVGPVGRVTGNSFYLVQYNAPDSKVYFSKYVAGTPTSFGSFAVSAADGTDHTVGLDMLGTTIRALFDGVEVASVTDSDVTAAGKAGLYHYASAANGNTDSTLASRIVAVDNAGTGGGGGGGGGGGRAVGLGMVPFVTDSFTDTAGVLLSAHTPELGGAPTRYTGSGYGIDAEITAGGRIRTSGYNGLTRYTYPATPSGADYDVAARFYVASLGDGNLGIEGRSDPAAVTCYIAYYLVASASWALYKAVANTYTSLGTYAQALTVGQGYDVVLEMRGTAIKVYIDGVERISVTDAAIAAAGKAGWRFDPNSVVSSESTFIQIEHFSTLIAPTGGADAVAPTVTLVSETVYAGQTLARALIGASTGEAAQFRVRWGTSPGVYTGGTTAYGPYVASGTTVLTALTGLPNSSTIYYVVDAIDPSGNVGTSSADSFATPAADNTAPTVGAVTVTPSGDGSSLNFAFTTNEAANCLVEVGTASGVYTLAASDTGYPTSHSIDVAGTHSGRTYYYRVTATDPATNTTVKAQATYANPAINAATITRLRVSRNVNTIQVEAWFNADDNTNLTATMRFKKSADPTWRTGLAPQRIIGDYNDGYGTMVVGFLANLDPATAYDVEVTLTDTDGLTASGVPLYTNEVTVGNATIAVTSGTVKVWTFSATTKTATNAAPGAATHYLSPTGNDTTGDGSVGTPWQSMNKAALSAPTGAIVQLAAGSYAPLTQPRTLPITFKAATLATSLGTVTESGVSKSKPAAANVGSRARVEAQMVYAPGSSWTSVSLAGPATGVSRQAWRLAAVPSNKLASFTYAADLTVEPTFVGVWDRKEYPFGSYTMATPAGWVEVCRTNQEYRYGWTNFDNGDTTVDVYAVLPAGVDPNTKYCRFAVAGDGTQIEVNTPGVRFYGLEFRQAPPGFFPGATGCTIDRCLLTNCNLLISGDKTATPNLRPADLLVEYNVITLGGFYSATPADKYLLMSWNWVKSTIVINGGVSPWLRIGSVNEVQGINTPGGAMRATVRGNVVDGWFNGLYGYHPGFDRFCMYHYEVHDNWFQHIADDPIEPETSVFGLYVWQNIFRNNLTMLSMSPANCGPVLMYGNINDHPTKVGFGASCGADGAGGSIIANGAAYSDNGGTLYDFKFGLNQDVFPHVYWWNNTSFTPDPESDGIAKANNGAASQSRPLFHFRNSIVRTTRYFGNWDSATDEDYDDFSTTDASRGVQVGGSNKLTIAAYRAAMPDPNGDHTNLRADFHTLVDSQFVDAANGDYRLVPASPLRGAGIAVPYWDRPGTDFANTTPNIGAVQDVAVDTTAPTVLTGPTPGTPTQTSCPVAWTLDEPGTGTLKVWVTADGEGTAVTFPAGVTTTSHSVTATGLTASTAYTCRATGADAAGNAYSSGTATFTTAANPDVTAPVLSTPTATPITESTATINWTTNEIADSVVRYRKTGDVTWITMAARDTSPRVTSHAYPLTGLLPLTGYDVQAQSTDASSNTSAFTATVTFTTLAHATTGRGGGVLKLGLRLKVA